MTLCPAPVHSGIWFKRVDVDAKDAMIPAKWDAVSPKALCTRIENTSGVAVSTIEHVMAALAGCGIANALIELDGGEVPIMDGSAAVFVDKILAKGVALQEAERTAIRVLQPIEVTSEDGFARLDPAASLSIDFAIEFDDAAIGAQSKTLNMANGTFVRELSDSRTFCRNSDVEAMLSAGLALGGTLENAVVVDGDRVLSPGGLRHADEAVRHKMLDALGDLALAGAPILGRYTGVRAGHAMTNRLLRALFADLQNYAVVACDEAIVANLPGTGVTRSEIPSHS